MPTTVVKMIGATNSPTTMDVSTLQSWEDLAPSNFTTTRAAITVTGSTSSTIMLDALASGTNEFYTGHAVWADARATEKRLITAYNGTTKVATIGALNGGNATWDNVPSVENYTIDSVIWQGQCYNQGELSSAANPSLLVSGETSSSTCYVELTTAAGASFKDHATASTNPIAYNTTYGCGIKNTTAYSSVISIAVDYTRISKLQCTQTGTPSSGLTISGSRQGIQYANLIVAANVTVLGTWGSLSTIVNCCAIKTTNNSASAVVVSGASAAYGCTVVRYSDKTVAGAAFTSTYGAGTIKNCAAFGFTNDWIAGTSGTLSASFCATDDTTPSTGFTGSLTYTSQFVGTTSSAPDYRAVSSGSLKNGTPDATNTPTDIIGQTRDATTPYIGAWEVLASGSFGPALQGRVIGPGRILGGSVLTC